MSNADILYFEELIAVQREAGVPTNGFQLRHYEAALRALRAQREPSETPEREALAHIISLALIENDRRKGSTIPIKPLPGFIDEVTGIILAAGYRRSALPVETPERPLDRIVRLELIGNLNAISENLGHADHDGTVRCWKCVIEQAIAAIRRKGQ